MLLQSLHFYDHLVCYSSHELLIEEKSFSKEKYVHLLDFFCFVALRPKSTAKVIAGRSVHLTTLFPWQA